jgi:hypothetical protein
MYLIIAMMAAAVNIFKTKIVGVTNAVKVINYITLGISKIIRSFMSVSQTEFIYFFNI